jgi:hypothetical protein
MYAATAPATMVPQNNTLFISAPFAEHLLVLANFRMQNGAWERHDAQECSRQMTSVANAAFTL